MAVLTDLSEADRKRLAICYIHMSNHHAVDSKAAAAFFNPSVKEESFKTQNGRSLKKYPTDGTAKISNNDIDRFATCFIHATSKQNVDWTAARNAFDIAQKIKVESFRTQTQRILKKFNGAGEPAKTPRKRKAATETDDGDAEDGMDKPKAKKTKGKAKTKKSEKVETGVVTDIDYENVFDEEPGTATGATVDTAESESVETDDY